MLTPLKKIIGRVKLHANIKFAEPIVVFESDDWGLWQTPPQTKFPKEVLNPKYWAYDQLENEEELENLYHTLESYSDKNGNPFRCVPNFITNKPDFSKTIKSDFKTIYFKPISKFPASLKNKWKEGISRGVFYPQYHGRFHFNFENLLESLQINKLAQQLFQIKINGGLNYFGDGWANHSEYLNWAHGTELKETDLDAWLAKGAQEFYDVFQYYPQSTIAPHYVFSPDTIQGFVRQGMKYVQGCNMQIFKKNGREFRYSLPLGSKFYSGAIAMVRNLRLEPVKNYFPWGGESAIERAAGLMKYKIPVVIDSHRINYVGKFAKKGNSDLNKLLGFLEKKKAISLTTVELGEAIANEGEYHDSFSGKLKKITPITQPIGRMVRNYLR